MAVNILMPRPVPQRNQQPQAPSEVAPLPIPPPPPPPPTSAAPAPPIGAGSASAGPQQQPRDAAPNSLSLAQLRRIVSEFPRPEAIAYDYKYADMSPLEEELDEWFNYSFWVWMRLNAANTAFDASWAKTTGGGRENAGLLSWSDPDAAYARERLVSQALDVLKSPSPPNSAAGPVPYGESPRADAIGTLSYVVLGRWTETVASARATVPSLADISSNKVCTIATKAQLDAVKDGVRMVANLGGIPILWDELRAAFEPFWADDPPGNQQGADDELFNLMTIVYVSIQITLDDPDGMSPVRTRFLALQPPLVHFMLTAVAKLRWDEFGRLPQTQMFLLLWKSILLVFGGSRELAEIKRATCETEGDDKDMDIITASPLDYHVFRQEITSKYPAYIPPQPKIPLEPESTTLLPPLPNHPARNNAAQGILSGPPGQSGGASILHQPVHIATPAPSPPPSPGVGGKGGKKQNYQTNQNFPFMYPPLDATSNSAGGKGGAGLQDVLVGRKWEGSDVPASILEAGELFSKRVRMTRATRQLWEARERFLKSERAGDEAGDGGDAGDYATAQVEDDDTDDDILDDLDLSELTAEEQDFLGLTQRRKAQEAKKAKARGEAERKEPEAEPRNEFHQIDYGPREVSEDTKRRLQAIDGFYRAALPHLQSLVIVLVKAIVLIASNSASPTANGSQPSQGNGRFNGAFGPGPGRSQDAGAGPSGSNGGWGEQPGPTDQDADNARTKEIAVKAVTGIMIMLLKWLKLSHILKFEYLSQLLVDSNYIPLALKLFGVHDIPSVVGNKTDRVEYSFFYYCASRAGALPADEPPKPLSSSGEPAEADYGFGGSDEDEAAPPPIRRRRSPTQHEASSPPLQSEKPLAPQSPSQGQQSPQANPSPAGTQNASNVARPEVDELGYPVNPLPSEPLTDFSRRNFFSLINYLRVLQKVCKRKAHRNLLLVQYKSAALLRKALRVPQQELRLYTLKLFKNQVPYCGRKWRQSNMRVITAVYLHCRPELRDEWLAGSDVDANMDEALPLEQALRSLTHWFNVRTYPDGVAPDVREKLQREHGDFFARELDRASELLASWAEAAEAEEAEMAARMEWDGAQDGSVAGMW